MPYNTDLVGSTIEMMALGMLMERSMYGYEIIQIVNDRTGGEFAWKEGTLYPVLHRLEGKGYLATEWQTGPTGKKRKYYKLTAKGQSYAKQKVDEWDTFSKCVETLLYQPAR